MATGLIAAGPYQERDSARAGRILIVCVPVLIAAFFFVNALRGIGDTGVIDTDAARHALNGAYVYDAVRTGQILHPGEYGMRYYGNLPALSMPYHPPLFPAIEALFYAVFGVGLTAARLAVATSVALAAILLYFLVQTSFRDRIMAACVTITVMSLATSQLVARDVMLEFPSMAFALGALFCLRHLDGDFSYRDAVLFAVLASAAAWTKQHTIFVGAVPVLYAVLSRRFRILLRPQLWVALAIFAAGVGALLFVSLHFNGAGLDQVGSTPASAGWNLGINFRYYMKWAGENIPKMPGIFTAICLVIYLAAIRKGADRKIGVTLYISWMALIVALLSVTTGSYRYLFFLYPAAIVVLFAMLFRGCAFFWGQRRAWYLPAALTAVWLIAGLRLPPEYLRGPSQAAAAVVERGTPTRILYAGEADGNFIFSIRSLEPKLEIRVIPGEKVAGENFSPAAFEQFCRQYAVKWVVVEDGPIRRRWSPLVDAPTRSMKLERTVALESNRTRWHTGRILIYRFENSTDRQGGVLTLPVPKIGRNIDVH